mgnify:CR=1 FL=1
MESPFDIPFDDLPTDIPIFPLPGAMLLPHGHLPLNLFEPRYLNMAMDALSEKRVIGMIQPMEYQPDPVPADAVLYKIGCTGRIISYAETEDGRIMITLKGMLRFNVTAELAAQNGYRCVKADYAAFRGDLGNDSGGEIPRDELLPLLRKYFDVMSIRVDWDALEKAGDEYLVTSLAMSCPFQVGEKQALLEAPNIVEMSRTLMALMEMAIRGGGEEPSRQ